ncbi:MAG: phytanoyl-CoA dioxygenase family protein [Halieaceae bacterium]
MNAFVDSAHLLEDAQALQQQFNSDGYVYIRGLLNKPSLISLRRQIVEICADCNWLLPESDPMEAVTWTMPKIEGENEYFKVYDRIQRLEDFHALAHDPDVMLLMRSLLGTTAFPHPLSIARLVFPENRDWSTPPHQDFVNNQGAEDLYACWIPLSNCPKKMGSLSILKGSHRLGLLPVEYALGAGHRQACIPVEAESLKWLSGDFSLGDVIVFHSLTVHKALPNDTDCMRISVDFRYQAEGRDITERCLRPHFEREDWSEIYRDWKSETLKYYWRSKNFNTVPFDNSLGSLPDEHLATAIGQQRRYDESRKALAEKYIKSADSDNA